jgi:aldose 1-epimerase
VVKGGRGQNLIPWPNRIRDGHYVFQGQELQLALSEPSRHNASHGLARHVPWVLIEHQQDQVVSRVRIYPQPGWPGTLEAVITHHVDVDGLTVTVEATNIGDSALPFGYAAHPYLTVGEATVDDVEVLVPASSYLKVDERLLPVSLVPVDGTDNDLRSGPTLGSRTLDVAMTNLARDSDGHWHAFVTLRQRRTELWGDQSMSWVQVFTGGPYRDWSVAVEPMTCGPDAFNAGPTHDGMLVLAPGEVFIGSWGISGR